LHRTGEQKKILERPEINMSFGKAKLRMGRARCVYIAFHGVDEGKLRWRLGYVNGDRTDLRPENLYLKKPGAWQEERKAIREPFEKFHPSTHPR
jgi:hypothetical protein